MSKRLPAMIAAAQPRVYLRWVRRWQNEQIRLHKPATRKQQRLPLPGAAGDNLPTRSPRSRCVKPSVFGASIQFQASGGRWSGSFLSHRRPSHSVYSQYTPVESSDWAKGAAISTLRDIRELLNLDLAQKDSLISDGVKGGSNRQASVSFLIGVEAHPDFIETCREFCGDR
jgi:hypothetical protein